MDKEKLIYDEAYKFLETTEIDGPKSNPLITQWILGSASWLNPDDSKTAWCGCFRGAIGVLTFTGTPSEYYRALSWKNWGKKSDIYSSPKGSTVILKRDGGYHVGLKDKISKDNIYILGGNQKNKVSIAKYKISDIVDVRISK